MRRGQAVRVGEVAKGWLVSASGLVAPMRFCFSHAIIDPGSFAEFGVQGVGLTLVAIRVGFCRPPDSKWL